MLRRLGGWPEDPVIEHVDDWALVHRIARAGELIGFVPVIAGRYLALADPFHLSVPDPRIGPDRVARTFDPTGRLRADDVAAFAAHPDLGPLWATPGGGGPPARARRARCPPAAAAAPTGTTAARRRARAASPTWATTPSRSPRSSTSPRRHRGLALDVVTDGDRPGRAPRRRPSGSAPSTRRCGGCGPTTSRTTTGGRCGRTGRRSAGSTTDRSTRASYRGAVFLGGGSLTSLWGDRLVAPRAVLALRAAAGRRAATC